LTRKKEPPIKLILLNKQVIKKMKKYILGAIALLMIAAVAAWNVNLGVKNKGLSDISLLNAEILAYGEKTGTWQAGTTSEYSECKIGYLQVGESMALGVFLLLKNS
jgi:hypothetical protein